MTRYLVQPRDAVPSRGAIHKAAQATGDLILNKINKITKTLPQNSSETVESETEISKERYISTKKRKQIIDDLRLTQSYNNQIKKENV